MSKSEANTTEVQREHLSLESLIKLLPEPFDGNSSKLRSFIKQVDATFELANPSQVQILLGFVKQKIIGKARDQIDIHCNLASWAEISELLLNLYQDKKSSNQLLEELTSIKQESGENVSQFYQRLEDLSSQMLANTYATETNDSSLSGRIAKINDLTLNRFVYHTCPQVSELLRYRNFSNINSALTAAVAEEKNLDFIYDAFAPRCNIRSGRKQNRLGIPFSRYYNFDANNPIFPVNRCTHCNIAGHDKEECRIRQYINAKQNSNSSSFRPNMNASSSYQQTSNSANNSTNDAAIFRLPERTFLRRGVTATPFTEISPVTPQPLCFLGALQPLNTCSTMPQLEYNAMGLL